MSEEGISPKDRNPRAFECGSVKLPHGSICSRRSDGSAQERAKLMKEILGCDGCDFVHIFGRAARCADCRRNPNLKDRKRKSVSYNDISEQITDMMNRSRY